MPFMIGSPSGIHAVGKPDVSVVGIIAPVAVVVEIVVADDVMRQVLRGARVIVAVITGFRPAVKLIGAADLLHVGVERIGAAEGAGLPSMQGVSLAVARRLALAFADGHDGVAAIFGGVEAIVPGLGDREREVWRIDFEIVIVFQGSHRDAE